MSAEQGPAEDVGYGRPPRSTRFKKGQSGNPKGRPRNRRTDIPYDGLLGRMVMVREDGRERRITAAEAFILQLTKKGLEGCSASARASLASIELARTLQRQRGFEQLEVRLCWRAFGIDTVVEDLGMAVRLNQFSKDNCRVMLKPWIVEAAVRRLAPGQLSIDQQRTVVESTQSPTKVAWPEWWEARP